MEEWKNLEDVGFPDYSVSNYGEVVSNVTGRVIRTSSNQAGQEKVGLINPEAGGQVTMTVARLVAHAFLPHPPNHRFNTPINVDGDRRNNHATNLMWRPRWFAVKYHQQFFKAPEGYKVPIEEIHTGEAFNTSWDAAVKYGLLDKEIALATMNRTFVFPTGQAFRVVD